VGRQAAKEKRGGSYDHHKEKHLSTARHERVPKRSFRGIVIHGQFPSCAKRQGRSMPMTGVIVRRFFLRIDGGISLALVHLLEIGRASCRERV